MRMARLRSWLKGNRNAVPVNHSRVSRPYCRLSLEQLEDRSLLSASFPSNAVYVIHDPTFLTHIPGRIISNLGGGAVGFEVDLGADINVFGIANANGAIIYEDQPLGAPFGLELFAKDVTSVLSPSTAWTANTLSAGALSVSALSGNALSVTSVPDGISLPLAPTTYSFSLAGRTLATNVAYKAESANADFSQLSLPFMMSNMTDVNGTLFIQGEDNGVEELWKSDGTPDGTILLNSYVQTFMEGMIDGGRNQAVVNGIYFFTSDDGVHGLELWKSDGTPNGTVMVKDINPGGAASYPSLMTNVNGTLYFSAYDGVSTGLWKSDGTADGTVEIAQQPNIGAIAAATNGALFTVDDASGWNLWKSDGTAAGTSKLALVNPYPNCVSFGLVSMNGSVYFAPDWNPDAGAPYYHMSLWKSDGTAAGTVMLSGFHSDGGFSYAYLNGNTGSTLYFPVYSGVGGFFDNYATPPQDLHELWKTDGTTTGTVPIKSFDSWFPESITDVNGRAFFTVFEGIGGSALWTTDGTANGTIIVKDFGSQAEGSPTLLTNVNGTLFFATPNGTQGLEIWKSDGTPTGTVQVANLNLVSEMPFSSFLQSANVGGTFFFTGMDQQGKTELWKTDGTSSGTILVKVFDDLEPSPAPSPVPGPGPTSTNGSPAPLTDPTTSSMGASADFVQAAQLLHNGSPAPADNSSLIVSNGQGSPYATATAMRFAATTISGSQDKAGTTGSLTIKATHYSSGTTQSILALQDGESVFDVEDLASVFRF